MRVRPTFWCLLALSCISVLILAATIREHVPAIMQVYIDQQPPISVAFTTLELHLSDSEGVPIEHAQVIPSANMTNMDMVANSTSIRELGRGNYSAQLRLYMAGPWKITIVAHAEGFESLRQTLFVQVV